MPPNTASSPLRVLLIDDSAAFTKTAQTYALIQGWELQIGTEATRWHPGKKKPQIVLLDYGLGAGSLSNLNAWVKQLEKAGLLGVTWLLSGSAGQDRQEFVKQWSLRGFLRKPIDLSQLPKLIEPEHANELISDLMPGTEPAANACLLDNLSRQLDSAIDIIDQASLEVVWSNHVAWHPLTPHDRKLLRLLEEELLSPSPGGRARKSAQRLDWDANKEPPAFRYTRLYPLGEHYWLTRDWRDGETIHDADLFTLEEMPDLGSRLSAATLYLAKRYGITRLRVYKIADLPHCTAYEPAPTSPLAMPLFQRGGGFQPDAGQWLHTGFLLSQNEETHKTADPDYVCKPEPVQEKVPEYVGCSTIVFGNAGTRAQFPVRDGQGMHALLAFDRRTDHLASLDQEDRELVEVALRIVGVLDGPLGEEEVAAMRGFLQDLGTRLLGWLKEDEDSRERCWQARISEVQRQSLTEQQRARDADPFDSLSSICASLLSEWKKPEIAGQVWGLLPGASTYPVEPRPDPLTGWYLALAQGQDQWQVVAGAGAIYRAYHDLGSPKPMLPPHRQAFSAEVWRPQPIQDYQAWREQGARAGNLPEEFRFPGALPDAIGAWLAVPMQLDEGVRALMVVHSPYRFHFTHLRCHLLRDAARRLLPPLAAALRESKTRGAFTAAVMHEVKTDTNAALEHCRLLEEHWGQNPAFGDDEATKRLDMVKHYLEGLSELGRDFLDVLRPGGDLPSRFQDDLEYELSLSQRVLAREWLDNLLRAWRWLYEDKIVEVRDGIGDQPVVLAAPALLRRVARVLLQNAYRHGEGEIEIQLDLADHDGRACLQMRIANLAYASVAAGVQGGTSATTAQIGPAPQARARVGLANAIRLAQAVGGSVETSHVPCKDHTDSPENEPMHRVSALLLWPLANLASNP